MNFAFSEQQEMLCSFARDFLIDKCPTEYVRAMEKNALGYSPEMWQEMAELGWMGLTSPEEYGGGAMGFSTSLFSWKKWDVFACQVLFSPQLCSEVWPS